jgi:hypothetical protein
MKYQRHISRVGALVITFFVVLLGVVPTAHAVEQVSVDNVQAAMRTLAFLESLPKNGTIIVGVVYPSEAPTAEALATETAKVIGAMRGPNSSLLQPLVLSTNNLAQYVGYLDVIFLVTGASKHSDVILSVMHRCHLLSVSDDLACLDAKCCVLMVHTGQRVEITLDTGLADAVGARFFRVFTMVVKRK